MRTPVILYGPMPDNLVKKLDRKYDLTRVDDLLVSTQRSFSEQFIKAEGIIGFGEVIDSTLLSNMPKLRACSTISVGYDNFDMSILNQRKIILMHTPTVLTETVADTAMALLLGTARRISELDTWVKAGNWRRNIGDTQFGSDVYNKTLGILGMGRIGKAISRRAHCGFGMKILYNSRSTHESVQTKYSAQYCTLENLMRDSDFICVVLPLTSETYHIVSSEQIGLMKSSAILINVGRGPVIDEKALIRALQDGVIQGAGLDVFEEEPLYNSPLFSLPNVITLPHVGSATHETRYNMANDAVENLAAALSNKVEVNCVNPQVLG